MATSTLYAPEVDGLTRIGNAHAPDLILPLGMLAQTLIALLRNIVPVGGLRSLWIESERGPIEAFGTYETLHDQGLFDTYAEFEDHWHACYPSDRKWYRITYDERGDAPRLSVNDRFAVRFVADAPECSDPAFAMQLLSWLVKGAETCVRQCAQGTYNERIREQLPFDMRMGVLSRKAYWSIFPESREYVRRMVRDKDIDRFVALFGGEGRQGGVRAGRPADGSEITTGGLPMMSVNDYLHVCRTAYLALGLSEPMTDATPADWHAAYANPVGRSMAALDRDDPKEFASWIADERDDGHTWEIAPGPGFSWFALTPVHRDDRWRLELRSAAYPMCADTIRLALLLHDTGLPVTVPNAHELANTVRGDDSIGILPHYLMPPYDDVAFPDAAVTEYIALPYERMKEVILHARWYPVEEVRLFDQTAEEPVDDAPAVTGRGCPDTGR